MRAGAVRALSPFLLFHALSGRQCAHRPSARGSGVDVKLVVLGSAFVGKTSIINRYCNQVFNNETRSTVGAGFFTHPLQVGGTEVTVMIWDTAGDERFRSITPSILRGAQGLVIVFDLTQQRTFSDLDIYLDLDTDRVNASDSPPVLLLGNKSDLAQRALSQEAIDKWMQTNRIPLDYEVSAKSGEQIEEAFFEIVNFVTSARTSMETHTPAIEIELADAGGENCC
jgi:small GTP-binding protein